MLHVELTARQIDHIVILMLYKVVPDETSVPHRVHAHTVHATTATGNITRYQHDQSLPIRRWPIEPTATIPPFSSLISSCATSR